MVRRGKAVRFEELKRIDQSFSKAAPKFAQVNPPRASDVDKLLAIITFVKHKFKIQMGHVGQADTQKDYFCPGTGIWIWKYPDNLFGQISSIKGYKSKYYGVSFTMAVKLVFI